MVAIDVMSLLPAAEPGTVRGAAPGDAPHLSDEAGFESLVARASVSDPSGEGERLPQPPSLDTARWTVPCGSNPAAVLNDERRGGGLPASPSDNGDAPWWQADAGDRADSLSSPSDVCAGMLLGAAIGAIPGEPAKGLQPDVPMQVGEPATTDAVLDPPEVPDSPAEGSVPNAREFGGLTMVFNPAVGDATGVQAGAGTGNCGFDDLASGAASAARDARVATKERTKTQAPAARATGPADGRTERLAAGTAGPSPASLPDTADSEPADASAAATAEGAAATIRASVPDTLTGSHWTPEVDSDRPSVAGALRALGSRQHEAAESPLDRVAPLTEPATPGNGRETLEAHRNQARALLARALGEVAPQAKAHRGGVAVAADDAAALTASALERVVVPGTGTDPQVATGEALRRYLDPTSNGLQIPRAPQSLEPRPTPPAPAADVDAAALMHSAVAAGGTRPVVAVPSTAETTPADAPDNGLAPQIVKTFSLAWRAGIGEARMRLEPERLGSVAVSLRVERGVVTATITAETPAVRDWVRAHESELRTALAGQGLDLEQLVVSADPDNRRDQREAGDEVPPRRPRRPSDGLPFTVEA